MAKIDGPDPAAIRGLRAAVTMHREYLTDYEKQALAQDFGEVHLWLARAMLEDWHAP